MLHLSGRLRHLLHLTVWGRRGLKVLLLAQGTELLVHLRGECCGSEAEFYGLKQEGEAAVQSLEVADV